MLGLTLNHVSKSGPWWSRNPHSTMQIISQWFERQTICSSSLRYRFWSSELRNAKEVTTRCTAWHICTADGDPVYVFGLFRLLCKVFDGSRRCCMITSSNGKLFRVTDPLWGESIGHRWIPLTKGGDGDLWCLLWSSPEQTIGQNIETPILWDAIALIMTSL